VVQVVLHRGGQVARLAGHLLALARQVDQLRAAVGLAAHARDEFALLQAVEQQRQVRRRDVEGPAQLLGRDGVVGQQQHQDRVLDGLELERRADGAHVEPPRRDDRQRDVVADHRREHALVERVASVGLRRHRARRAAHAAAPPLAPR
jgi:hypothetical protein